MFPVFDGLESMAAVRTLEFYRSGNLFASNEGLAAYFALKLTMTTIVIINVVMWSTAKRADGIFRDIVLFAFLRFDRLKDVAITQTIVFNPKLPVLFDKGFDDGKFVCGKFLIGRAVDFIMSPLFERDISADKENKPANLLMLFLNNSK